MKRLAPLLLLLACGCRDLHVHVHLPPRQILAQEKADNGAYLHVDTNGESPSTEAELLQEILK